MKRGITLVGAILVCLLLGGGWLNHQYLDNGAAFAKESEKELSDEVLLKNTRMLTNKIQNKLKEEQISDIAAIGVSYQSKEIHVRVNGTQQYLNKVEKNIKKIVNGLAQETIFKDYSIGVYIQIIDANKLALKQNELLSKLTLEIQESLELKGYGEIENILTEKQSENLIIDVNTSIQKNGPTSINRGKDIEKEIRESLPEEMSTLIAENQTLVVNVYNINSEKIN